MSGRFRSIARRRMMLGLGTIILAAQRHHNEAWAATPLTDEVEFFCGKSGRYGHQDSPRVAIGGLLVPARIWSELEGKLRGIAEGMSFKKQLEFSTGEHDPEYFSRCLGLLRGYGQVSFAISKVDYDHWPDNNVEREAFRKFYEQRAFAEILATQSFRIHSLRHDFGQDARILASVKIETPSVSEYEIHEFPNTAPRLLQLAGTLVKCLNNTSRLAENTADQKTGAVLKNRMISRAISSLNLSSDFTPSVTPKLIRNFS